MKTKKTITVCFKDNKNVKTKTFTVSSIIANNSLNFQPLFKVEEDQNMSPYSEKSEEEKKLYRIFTAEVETDDLEKTVTELEKDSNIEFVEINELFETKYIPNDPLYSQLYGLKKTECEKAWLKSTGKDIIVAVLDTGVDYNHPDIKANMWSKNGKHGYDFSDNNDNPQDKNGHGTHVAGTIAATMNNNVGIVGVAPGCKIMAVKIFPNAYPNVITKALKYAVDNGAKILNNSWGPTNRRPSSPTIESAIDYVHSKGGICVFAAGNSGDDTRYYSPANYSKTIAVGATDRNDNLTSFSNYGSDVTVNAPGNRILSLENNTNRYTNKSGTSMAAPHVSGALALHLSLNPSKTFDDLVTDLKTKSDNSRLNCDKLIK